MSASVIGEVTDLFLLHKAGGLDEGEFADAKEAVIGGPDENLCDDAPGVQYSRPARKGAGGGGVWQPGTHPVKRFCIEMTRKRMSGSLPHGILSVQPDRHNPGQVRAVLLGAEGSPYAGGKFEIEVFCSSEYPMNPPLCRFATKIWHPNISNIGMICLDTISDQWSPALNVTSVLLSIQQLFNGKNLDDPLNDEACQHAIKDPAGFDRRAREWTQRYARAQPDPKVDVPMKLAPPGTEPPLPRSFALMGTRKDAQEKTPPVHKRNMPAGCEFGPKDMSSACDMSLCDWNGNFMCFTPDMQRTGFYGRILQFAIYVPMDFPSAPPRFRFINRVNMDCVDGSGNVNLGALGCHWNADMTLAEVCTKIKGAMTTTDARKSQPGSAENPPTY